MWKTHREQESLIHSPITTKRPSCLCLNNSRVNSLFTARVGHLLESFSFIFGHNLPPTTCSNLSFCPPNRFQINLLPLPPAALQIFEGIYYITPCPSLHFSRLKNPRSSNQPSRYSFQSLFSLDCIPSVQGCPEHSTVPQEGPEKSRKEQNVDSSLVNLDSVLLISTP